VDPKDVTRKLSAILSADVQGYSRLMGDDERATVQTITAYRKVMTDLIQAHHGKVVDAKGDNVLAEFPSVVDAIQCAVEIQKELKVKNADFPEHRRMEFRIGINLGDVIEEEETIYGDGVNIAARVESLAKGGEICISGTAFDQIGKKVPLGYEYLGEQTVKNIEKPIRVYKVLVEPKAVGKVIGENRRLKMWHWTAIFGLAVLIIVAGSLAFWEFYMRPDVAPASVEKMAHPLPDKPSIAVLPFDNMSKDPEQDYFSDGITENIITSLAKIPDLFVIARNSTFTYKGKPVKVQQVAEELGVQYVLEGSVLKSEDRVRVTAQLIDALSGKHLWAERYDRKLKDIFAVQDDITKNVIAALQLKLTVGEVANSASKGTDNLQAYLRYMKGLSYVSSGLSIDNNVLARQLCEEAIALDPEYVGPYVTLAWTHLMDIHLGVSKSPKESLMRAAQLAKKALIMDRSWPGPHIILSQVFIVKRAYDKAIAEAEKAIALSPNNARAHAALSRVLTYAGKFEESLHAAKKALRFSPIPPKIYFTVLGGCYLHLGRTEEAIREYKKVTKHNPNDLVAHIRLAASYGVLGRETEARAEAAEVLRLNPKFSIKHVAKTWPYKNRDDLMLIINGLRKVGLPEKPPLPLPDKPSIAVLPFDNMSKDPEQEYFSDGITEEIITALAKVPDLFVIARNSSFTYKGKPVKVQQVAEELGVQYVLEGSVRKSEERIRVTAQLIDAINGNHLWAERYDRELKEIFAVQDEITFKILEALHIKITGDDLSRSCARGTDNVDAYLKLLQARQNVYRLNIEGITMGRKFAEEAVALDPNYSTAYCMIAFTHMMDVYYGGSKSPKKSLEKAFLLTKKSLSLDSTCAFPYVTLAYCYLLTRQHAKAIAACEKALDFDPNDAFAYSALSMVLTYSGKPEEAMMAIEKAFRLNPKPPAYDFLYQGFAYFHTGMYAEGALALKKGLDLQPNSIPIRLRLASCYGSLDREDEARAEVAAILKLSPRLSLDYLAKTYPYKNKTDLDQFINALRKAGLK